MQMESVAKIHILLLEDDPDERAPLPAMLEQKHGFHVTATTTPFGEAGNTAQRIQPDVAVIADVAGDPVAIVEELDEAVPGLPVIVSLRPERQDLAQACILAGARAYVLRSDDPNELALVIRQVQGKELRRRKHQSVAAGQHQGR